MPKLELGDLEAVEKLKDVNIRRSPRWRATGYAILTPVPSCTLMFKQELPLMFPGRRRRRRRSRDAMFDPFEYLVLRDKDGLLQEGLQARRSARSAITSPATRACRTSGRRRARCCEWIPGHDGQHGRALRRPRRHVGREERVLRELDEDRQAGVPPDGARPSPTTSAPTARSPAAGSRRASRRGGKRAPGAQGTSADAAAHRLRTVVDVDRQSALGSNHRGTTTMSHEGYHEPVESSLPRPWISIAPSFR